MIPTAALALAAGSSAAAQAPPPLLDVLAGQELIYRGRFEAARDFFARRSAERAADPVGPVLEASALIWWGEALDHEDWRADTIDLLLDDAVARARGAVAAAAGEGARTGALFWLGTALGYRARQAELRGNFWSAARDAKAMRAALEEALETDPGCVDCLLGLAVYDYALARAGSLARIVARIVGMGGGDATLALERMRRAGEEGLLTRTEARWVHANALLREGARDEAMREQGRRILAALAAEFPDNPVFRRAAAGP